MPVTIKIDPAAASTPPTVNPQDALDPNETIIQSPAPAFKLSSLPTFDGQDSEMIGTFIAILLCLYVIKVIIEVIPKILLIGIGACAAYAFLK